MPKQIKEPVDEEDLYGEGFFNTTKALIYGRNDYPPKGREVIKQYGNKMIQSLTIIRHPIQQAIVELLNVMSFGAWKKNMAKQPYDKLFHLGLIIQFEDGTVILAEKNEVINLTNVINVDKKAETKKVDNLRQGITLNTMLEKAQKLLGPKYFTYSAYDNNCQYYIMSLLKGIGAGSDKDFNFIKQNTEELFEANPSLIGISNKVTDTGAFIDVLTHGGSINNISRKNTNKGIKIMSEAKLIEAIGKLGKILKKHKKIHGGSVSLNKAVKSLSGSGDLIHIDLNSHNASSKGGTRDTKVRNSMSGGNIDIPTVVGLSALGGALLTVISYVLVQEGYPRRFINRVLRRVEQVEPQDVDDLEQAFREFNEIGTERANEIAYQVVNEASMNSNSHNLFTIDEISESSETSGNGIKRNKISGGDLVNRTIRHTGLDTSSSVPDFKNVLMSKEIRSRNPLLNRITSNDVEAIKTLFAQAKTPESDEGKKVSKLEAKRIGAEIALINAKKRTIKPKASSGYTTTKTGRLVKGSPEAKAWAERMKELRAQKKNQ